MIRINTLAANAALLISLGCAPLVGQATTGYIKTSVNPGRAGVFIDGKYVGPAANFKVSRKYAVSPGEHEVKLLEPRYEDIVKKVTVQAGKTTKVSETMKALPAPKPPFGVLRTIGPDHFAAVYLNDKFMGHVDEFSNAQQGLKIAPGTYTIRIVPVSGGSEHKEEVKIEADKTTIVRAK